MPRQATGEVIERDRQAGRLFALRFAPTAGARRRPGAQAAPHFTSILFAVGKDPAPRWNRHLDDERNSGLRGATKRQTRPTVCRNAAETGAKSGKARNERGISKTTKIPAKLPDFRPNAARLKIVVSPVRVRVSPSPAMPDGYCISRFAVGWQGSSIWA